MTPFLFKFHCHCSKSIGGNYNNRQGGSFRQDGGGFRNDQQFPRPTNDRWQEQEPRPDNQYAPNQRSIPKGDNIDYTVQLARNERLETELFGVGNTGINFNKYEDIPGKFIFFRFVIFEDFLFSFFKNMTQNKNIRKIVNNSNFTIGFLCV